MTALQIAAYALGFAVAGIAVLALSLLALQSLPNALGFAVTGIAVLAWLIIALDRVADRDVEERKKRKKLDLP